MKMDPFDYRRNAQLIEQRLSTFPAECLASFRSKPLLFILGLAYVIWSFLVLFPAARVTSDFEFHYLAPNGTCPEGYTQQYCDDYHPLTKLLAFPNQETLFLFYATIAYLLIPMLAFKNEDQGLTYVSLGIAPALLFNATFAQLSGLPLIWLWTKEDTAPTTRTLILIASRFVHKYLFYFLAFSTLILIVWNSIDKYNEWLKRKSQKNN